MTILRTLQNRQNSLSLAKGGTATSFCPCNGSPSRISLVRRRHDLPAEAPRLGSASRRQASSARLLGRLMPRRRRAEDGAEIRAPCSLCCLSDLSPANVMLTKLVVQGAYKGPAPLQFCPNEPASPTNYHLLSPAPTPLKIISAFSNGTRDHHFIQHFRTARHLRSRRCPRRPPHQRSRYSISSSPSGRCVLLRSIVPPFAQQHLTPPGPAQPQNVGWRSLRRPGAHVLPARQPSAGAPGGKRLPGAEGPPEGKKHSDGLILSAA